VHEHSACTHLLKQICHSYDTEAPQRCSKVCLYMYYHCHLISGTLGLLTCVLLLPAHRPTNSSGAASAASAAAATVAKEAKLRAVLHQRKIRYLKTTFVGLLCNDMSNAILECYHLSRVCDSLLCTQFCYTGFARLSL
jgi:hypothetical protein